MSGAQGFVSTWGGLAQQAGASLGIDPNIILSQWALESGYGTNSATTQNNNPGSIMPGGTMANYSSPGSFEQAYVNTVANDFPAAVGVGNNATAFVTALGNGVNGSYYGNENPAAYLSGITSAESNLTGQVSNTTSSGGSTPSTGYAPSTSATNTGNCGILNGGLFTWSCWGAIAADMALVVLGAGMIFGAFMSTAKGGDAISIALPTV